MGKDIFTSRKSPSIGTSDMNMSIYSYVSGNFFWPSRSTVYPSQPYFLPTYTDCMNYIKSHSRPM